MNVELKQELEAAIKSDVSLNNIVALLRRYKERGVSQDEVYAFLDSLHQAAPDEATDDRILEVADFVAGFCSRHMKVWEESNPTSGCQAVRLAPASTAKPDGVKYSHLLPARGLTMPVHDWTLVDAGIFHDFHVAWIPEIKKALNGGLLPEGYYALAEQHAGRSIADVLTLHASPASWEPLPLPPATGGTAVAEAPPRVRRRQIVEQAALARRRTLAIRHVSGHRLVALLEIVSPANKDRRRTVEEFAAKVVDALEVNVHVLVVDLFPPGPNDPQGMHGVIWQHLDQSDEPYDLPPEEPLTLASYASGTQVEMYIEHVAAGASLPEMPLFLRPDRYINVPLEATYQEAYRGVPAFWREVLERRPA